MEEKPKKRLGEILIEDGLLSRENLEEALAHQKREGGLIGQILIQLGHLTEEDLVSVLARQLRMPYLPLNQYAVNVDGARILEGEFCKKNMLLVFDADDRRVFVATSDPLNQNALEELRAKLKLKPQVFLSTPTEIMNMLDLVFANQGSAQTKKKAG